MTMTLLDWRRRVAALYAQVRANSPEDGHALWHAGRDELLRSHPDSPLLPEHRAGFAGLPVAPYDPALRFEVALDTDVEPARWSVRTGTDGVVPFRRIGVAHLPIGSLDVWWIETYAGGVFVPVKDPSPDTYGGGRYLLDTAKGADLGSGGDANSLVLDLNFAYNPSCAYDPAWACPLAPVGNTLAAPVGGGERYAIRRGVNGAAVS